MPNFSAKELTEICLNVFRKLKVPAAEAEIVTRSMVDANRVGHDSHGVIHLACREVNLGVVQEHHQRCRDSNFQKASYK